MLPAATEVTMFLSLVALQFTFTFPPASRLNAIQQLVVACYCVIGVNSLSHLLVYFLARWQDRHTRCHCGQPQEAEPLTIGAVAAAPRTRAAQLGPLQSDHLPHSYAAQRSAHGSLQTT